MRLQDYDTTTRYKAKVLGSERITSAESKEEVREISIEVESQDFDAASRTEHRRVGTWPDRRLARNIISDSTASPIFRKERLTVINSSASACVAAAISTNSAARSTRGSHRTIYAICARRNADGHGSLRTSL